MDYKAKQSKRRMEAAICIAIVISLSVAYAAYRYFNRDLVQWQETEYKIPDFRDADANLIGRKFDLVEQQRMDTVIRETVEAYYRENAREGTPSYTLAVTFEETFEQELKVTIEVNDDSDRAPKTTVESFKRDADLEAGATRIANKAISTVL